MKKGLIVLIATVLLKAISPVLRIALVKGINDINSKAKETDNPYDDLLMELVADMLQIELD